MKGTTNEVARTLWVCLGVVALPALGVWMLAGCETVAPGKTMSAADCIRAQKQHEAEIRAEANAPGPSLGDEHRIASALGARAAQEQHELAQQARFEFEQRLELAEASAPRIYTSPDENQGGVTLGQVNPERRTRTFALAGHASHRDRLQVASGGSLKAPDRYFVRGTLDDSANQTVADSADRDREADAKDANANSANGAPFGNPVPGKAGYVTSPASAPAGYIDVRGYDPGATVIDPYTGRMMRVP